MPDENKLKIWSVLVALVFLLLAPLAAYGETFSSTAIAVRAPSTKISVTRIRSGLLPGIVVGGHYQGLFRGLNERYTAAGRLDESLEAAFRRELEDELVQAGYAVAGAHGHSVFADQVSTDDIPARFLLGGTITDVQFNSYSSWFASNTEDQRTIRWEVLDRETNRVIANRETVGKAKVSGVDNPAATYEAVRNSFKAFLAEAALETALKQASEQWQTVSSEVNVAYNIRPSTCADTALTIEQIAGRSIPSIVGIRTPEVRGSGFFIDSSGLLLTNHHVVGSSFSVQVDLYDGSTQSAQVVAVDPRTDVALLKLKGEASNLRSLPICTETSVKVGEDVVAIGHPLAFSNTVTRGIVSGIRTLEQRDLIQTDVAINPGNSGGPLLNKQGAVIGIVTEKVAGRGVEGLGFALPIAESLQKLSVSIQKTS
ncbi:S1C family serine protease [Leptolyngbya sp. FACHB-261]|uniref:S1C family serine protease n=1 Tax=Leptolyngbya sp. FACHB-261 TaxID=2692806 RepID=UPI00168241E6|nr:trypsin-like peptidase domain-containing protein [Leptolyngbya sp. FACHB-261]MBD2100213.1 trypsin-like peptidase domain-containing protein [Leptolyngbya sp. FACHB-261]